MSQFLIIAYPHESCGWVSMLPDFVGATGRGNTMELAMWRASRAAQQVCELLARLDKPLPTPTDLASTKKMHLWVGTYGVDWSTAVVRSIQLSDTSQIARRSRTAHQAPRPALVAGRQRSRTNGSIPDSLAQIDVR